MERGKVLQSLSPFKDLCGERIPLGKLFSVAEVTEGSGPHPASGAALFKAPRAEGKKKGRKSCLGYFSESTPCIRK